MTRRPGHDAVLRTLKLALALPGLQAVKLNVVIVRGLNDDEIPAFVELTRCVRPFSYISTTNEKGRESPLSVRFIEFMPLTVRKLSFQIAAWGPHSSLLSGKKWNKSMMVPSSTLLERICATHADVTKEADEVNDTARSYRIPGYRGTLAFISSMSDHFCGTCNRLRLTADGQIKVCV